MFDSIVIISEVSTISNFDLEFCTVPQDLFDLSTANTDGVPAIDIGPLLNENIFLTNSENLTIAPTGNIADCSNEMFVTMNVPVCNEEVEESVDNDEHGTSENNESQNVTQTNSCCKCHQKVLNKIDYVQKKLFKEMSSIRQEAASNRKLLLQILQTQQPSNVEFEANRTDAMEDDAQTEIDMIEFDQFVEKCKEIFPIKDADSSLTSTNL